MANVINFTLKSGRWTYPIDPDDQEWFGVDAADFLPPGESLTSVATGAPADPAVILTGVTQMPNTNVRIQGAMLLVMLTGGDTDPDVDPTGNACTFRFYTSTGERFDRTIYFTVKDK